MTNLFADVDEMRRSGFESVTIEIAERRNGMLKKFLASPLGDHIRSIEDTVTTEASGGRLLGLDAVKMEIEELAPSSILFPHGYFPIWSSIGGNIIVYGLTQRQFLWADKISWNPDPGYGEITMPITYDCIPYTTENIPKAFIMLSNDSPKNFLDDLRSGIYEERLEELD